MTTRGTNACSSLDRTEAQEMRQKARDHEDQELQERLRTLERRKMERRQRLEALSSSPRSQEPFSGFGLRKCESSDTLTPVGIEENVAVATDANAEIEKKNHPEAYYAHQQSPQERPAVLSKSEGAGQSSYAQPPPFRSASSDSARVSPIDAIKKPLLRNSLASLRERKKPSRHKRWASSLTGKVPKLNLLEMEHTITRFNRRYSLDFRKTDTPQASGSVDRMVPEVPPPLDQDLEISDLYPHFDPHTPLYNLPDLDVLKNHFLQEGTSFSSICLVHSLPRTLKLCHCTKANKAGYANTSQGAKCCVLNCSNLWYINLLS